MGVRIGHLGPRGPQSDPPNRHAKAAKSAKLAGVARVLFGQWYPVLLEYFKIRLLVATGQRPLQLLASFVSFAYFLQVAQIFRLFIRFQ